MKQDYSEFLGNYEEATVWYNHLTKKIFAVDDFENETELGTAENLDLAYQFFADLIS